MISKTLILLASSAAMAAAHSFGDNIAGIAIKGAMADVPVLHQYEPMAKKHALGPSQYHHHPLGPSQYHHHTETATKGEDNGPHTLSLTRSGMDNGPQTLSLTRSGMESATNPTLSLTRSNYEMPTSSNERQNPKFTSMPESHLKGSDDAGSNGGEKDHGSPSKSSHGAGASQKHHHAPGPSQYHHNRPNPYFSSTPDKMHYNNGNGQDNTDGGRNNPKVHHGTGAHAYMPYVEGGSDGKGNNSGNTGSNNGGSSDNNNSSGYPSTSDNSGSNGSSGGDDSTKPPQGYGASASARARIAQKNKSSGMYALYGQAAANACGMDEQMPGAEITACPLESGSGWDCLNLASTLESCGGCMSIGEGQDCTLIKGADSVGCIHGKCIIGTCESGYYLDADKGECVAN